MISLKIHLGFWQAKQNQRNIIKIRQLSLLCFWFELHCIMKVSVVHIQAGEEIKFTIGSAIIQTLYISYIERKEKKLNLLSN